MSAVQDAVAVLESRRFDYGVLPLRKSLEEFVRTGIPRGDFLTSLLAHDYRRAILHADTTNRWLIPIYIAYIDNEVPDAAQGSIEKVAAYANAKREERASRAVARHGGDSPDLPTRKP